MQTLTRAGDGVPFERSGSNMLSELWQIVTATPFEHRSRLLDRAEGPGHAPTRQRPQQGTERT